MTEATTDVGTAPETEGATYGSTEQGLREAAADLRSRREEDPRDLHQRQQAEAQAAAQERIGELSAKEKLSLDEAGDLHKWQRDVERTAEIVDALATEEGAALHELNRRRGVRLLDQAGRDGLARHQDLATRPAISVSEAREQLRIEKIADKAFAEAELAEILAENRQAQAAPPPEPPPQQQPDEEAQQRLNQHVMATRLASADAAASQQLSQIGLAHARLVAQAKSAFPEIVAAKTEMDKAAAIAAMSPTRQQQFAALDTESRRLWGMAGAWNAERERYRAISSGQAQRAAQAAARQQFARWAEQQDAAVVAAVPELSDERAAEFQKACREVLKDSGVSDREVLSVWNTPAFRAAQSQLVIAEAARMKLTRQSLERAKVPPRAPKFRQPGNGRDIASAGDRHIGELSRQLTAAKGRTAVGLAADILKARRAGRH